MIETKTIAETNRFIVLDRYEKDWKLMESYQSEDALERELIQDLENLGYTFERELNSPGKAPGQRPHPTANA
jgi:type I restriction enzyme R subunit